MAVTGPVNRARPITTHSARLNTHSHTHSHGHTHMHTQTGQIPCATSHKPEAGSMLRLRKKMSNNPKEKVV